MVVIRKLSSRNIKDKNKQYYKAFLSNLEGKFFMHNNLRLGLKIKDEEYDKNVLKYNGELLEGIFDIENEGFLLLHADCFSELSDLELFLTEYIEPRIMELKLTGELYE